MHEQPPHPPLHLLPSEPSEPSEPVGVRPAGLRDPEAIAARISVLLDRIRIAHRELGESPDPHGPREAALEQLVAQRDALTHELGLAVLRVIAAGGRVGVLPPSPPTVEGAPPSTMEHPPVQAAPVAAAPAPAAEAPSVGPEAPRVVPAEARPVVPAERPPVVPAEAPPVVPVAPAATPAGRQVAETAVPAATRDRAPDRMATPPIVPPTPGTLEPAPERSRVRASTIPTRPPSSTPAGAGSRSRARPTVPPELASGRGPAPRDLRGLMSALGKPVRVTTPELASETVARLVHATSDLDGWLVYPPEVQRSMVGLVSSIARHVQDEAEQHLDSDATNALRAWFPMMTHWSKLYRPGFVPGLSRKFGSERESWLADALHWWWVLEEQANPGSTPELVERAAAGPRSSWASEPPEWSAGPRGVDEPELPSPADALKEVERAAADPNADLGAALQLALDAGVPQRNQRLLRALLPQSERVFALPGLKTLKTALREAGEPDDDEEEAEREITVVPALDDWPFFTFTEGKQAVIVGGDRRPQAAERIRDAFRFEDVEWEVKDPRRLRALAERVRSRSVDLVILLRSFISHAEQETVLDACRAASVPFVVVDAGYGVNQVKLAIERFCGVEAK
jgi:hypothetical protein